MKTANLNLLNDDYAAPRAASVELINEGALLASSEPEKHDTQSFNMVGLGAETPPDFGPGPDDEGSDFNY